MADGTKKADLGAVLYTLLLGFELTREHRDQFKKYNSNWTYLSAYMSLNQPSLQELCILLKLELERNAPRVDIVTRITGSINKHLAYALRSDLYQRYTLISQKKKRVQSDANAL